MMAKQLSQRLQPHTRIAVSSGKKTPLSKTYMKFRFLQGCQIILNASDICEINWLRGNLLKQGERSRKYRSTNVYTSNYIRHHTVQCGCIRRLPLKQSRPTSREANRFSSDKLYICLSNKCFDCIQCICCVTDLRP